MVHMTGSQTTQNKATGIAIFSLSSIDCSSPALIESKLKKLSGVKDATVNCVTNMVLVNYDPKQLDSREIRALLRKLKHGTTFEPP